MNTPFGRLENGAQANLYTLEGFGLTAQVTDLGATLVRLLVPDAAGKPADVVLGFDDAAAYARSTAYLGATVGRNANRIAGASFLLEGREIRLPANEGPNSLHSGPDSYAFRLWEVECQSGQAVTFRLRSPHGDQGFPGSATVWVTYALEAPRSLRITYRAESDRATVFNLTNHSYFNLAGQENAALAMDQRLTLSAPAFLPADEAGIPTGEERPVEGTAMDLRAPRALGEVLKEDSLPLKLQGGLDHCFVLTGPAVLEDPHSGRRMTLTTDCPGLQVYTANFLNETGKGGVPYPPRSAVALEPQFYPDFVHHPRWPQSVGREYRRWTLYRFDAGSGEPSRR